MARSDRATAVTEERCSLSLIDATGSNSWLELTTAVRRAAVVRGAALLGGAMTL